MENDIPKISVIVPVYNVEKYLDRCIQSILNQTLKELEIILVDDGSPDNCPALWGCIYNHRTTKTNQKYPSVNL